MKNGRKQAKDISDRDILALVDKKEREQSCWSYFWELADALGVDGKLVLAKCAGLIRRGLMSGCTCGCRGDFELTAEGSKVLAIAETAAALSAAWKAGRAS